jgi:hypothetical protein
MRRTFARFSSAIGASAIAVALSVTMVSAQSGATAEPAKTGTIQTGTIQTAPDQKVHSPKWDPKNDQPNLMWRKNKKTVKEMKLEREAAKRANTQNQMGANVAGSVGGQKPNVVFRHNRKPVRELEAERAQQKAEMRQQNGGTVATGTLGVTNAAPTAKAGASAKPTTVEAKTTGTVTVSGTSVPNTAKSSQK